MGCDLPSEGSGANREHHPPPGSEGAGDTAETVDQLRDGSSGGGEEARGCALSYTRISPSIEVCV